MNICISVLLIDGNSFFLCAVKNNHAKKLLRLVKIMITQLGLLDYKCFSKHYKNSDLKQQINFIGKLEKDKATIFFIIEKSEETIFEFSQNSMSII